MKTQQVNLRLETDLVEALEQVAREESLDRSTVVRRLLKASLERWRLERALQGYQRGELSLGRAAEEAGLSQWELLDAIREAGIAYPLSAGEVEDRLESLPSRDDDQFPGGGGGFRTRTKWLGQEVETLADVPPKPGGVLLVGINPAPDSVAPGHYYQGRIGRRLWARLEQIGLLADPVPGAEDEAFREAGHGLTDLVKRPTASSDQLASEELTAGAEIVRAKVRDWRPGLVLFAFKGAAEPLVGGAAAPGEGPELEGARTFLLSGPYAPRELTAKIDEELRRLLREAAGS